MSSSAGATEDISTLSSETQPSTAGCKSALLRLYMGTRFGSAQALSLAKAHTHACHPICAHCKTARQEALSSYEPRFRPGPNRSLRTHQDLARQRKQTLPPTNCCFNHCRPWWLPLPDPKQLLAPVAMLASMPLWPSRICNSSFKTAFTVTNCAANVRPCQTTLEHKLMLYSSTDRKEIIRLNLQVTNQQKSPVQPQYGTQKTSNETILGEDKNNVMLS